MSQKDILEIDKRCHDEIRMMKELGLFTAKCPYCDILLHGYWEHSQHMYHEHDVTVEI